MSGKMRGAWLGSIVMAATLSCAHAKPGPALNMRAPFIASTRTTPSLWQQPWRWQDEDGRAVTLARWRGQPLVVAALFTRCKATCPRTLARLRQVYSEFQHAGRSAQFVIVTLDPANDTPEALRRYKSSAKLPESWHLLTGDWGQTKELCNWLGVHFIEDGPHLLHDGRIVVFDAEGRPARALEGWDLDDEVRL